MSVTSGSAELIGNVTESTEKVDRVRDILFGSHMRDYAQKFDTLTRELARLQQEVARLHEQLREQDKTLRKQLRDDSERLTLQWQEQEQRHTQQLQASEQNQAHQIQALDQRHMHQAERLGEQVRHTEATLLSEVSRLTGQLNHTKTDRSTLADLFMQLSASLQEHTPASLPEPADLLDQLSQELR
ncbi:MAG: hypothetical protein M3Q45_11900 [Chloroflexota bacterium]|nr:hypothetical protein [Chloroflexota bacterium]